MHGRKVISWKSDYESKGKHLPIFDKAYSLMCLQHSCSFQAFPEMPYFTTIGKNTKTQIKALVTRAILTPNITIKRYYDNLTFLATNL